MYINFRYSPSTKGEKEVLDRARSSASKSITTQSPVGKCGTRLNATWRKPSRGKRTVPVPGSARRMSGPAFETYEPRRSSTAAFSSIRSRFPNRFKPLFGSGHRFSACGATSCTVDSPPATAPQASSKLRHRRRLLSAKSALFSFGKPRLYGCTKP